MMHIYTNINLYALYAPYAHLNQKFIACIKILSGVMFKLISIGFKISRLTKFYGECGIVHQILLCPYLHYTIAIGCIVHLAAFKSLETCKLPHIYRGWAYVIFALN